MSVVNHEWERIPQQLILKQSHKHMRKSIINSKFEWLKKYLEQSSNLRKSSLMKQGNHLKHTSFLKQRQNVTQKSTIVESPSLSSRHLLANPHKFTAQANKNYLLQRILKSPSIPDSHNNNNSEETVEDRNANGHSSFHRIFKAAKDRVKTEPTQSSETQKKIRDIVRRRTDTVRSSLQKCTTKRTATITDIDTIEKPPKSEFLKTRTKNIPNSQFRSGNISLDNDRGFFKADCTVAPWANNESDQFDKQNSLMSL